jgi:NAD(P)-dependent dehydrogenase (short-subunit alcohol dehydrogenase family)
MVLDLFRVDGKVALVTGATRGIGLGIARALAEAGATVVATSKSPNPKAMAEIEAAGGGRKAHYVAADMEDPASPKRIVDETVRLGGRIDILVVNHGIAGHGDTATFPYEQYRKIMTTNVDSLFLCCQAALVEMRSQGGGVLLAVGSMSGIIANIPQAQAAYNSSKAAVHMMMQSIASDYAAENIRANSIAPGYIATDMTAPHFEGEAWGPTWRSQTPMGRMGTIEEIGAASLFLCSPASGYVTGTVLVADGGYTAR